MTPLEQKFVDKFGQEPSRLFNSIVDETCWKAWRCHKEGFDFALQSLREELLCPVHANLDRADKLEPFNNCVACIRNQRDELLKEKQALRELPGDEEEQRIRNHCRMLTVPGSQDYKLEAAADLATLLDTVKALRLRIAELEGK